MVASSTPDLLAKFHNVNMGEVASVIKALSCESCARYVCNAMHCKSKCRDCCEIDFVTEQIELPDDDSTHSVEVDGCCEARKV